MMSNDGCSRQRVAVLVIATCWLAGCATVGSETSRFGTCAPAVEYYREFQARAADEPVHLPEGSAIEDLQSDYAVMRKPAPACR